MLRTHSKDVFNASLLSMPHTAATIQTFSHHTSRAENATKKYDTTRSTRRIKQVFLCTHPQSSTFELNTSMLDQNNFLFFFSPRSNQFPIPPPHTHKHMKLGRVGLGPSSTIMLMGVNANAATILTCALYSWDWSQDVSKDIFFFLLQTLQVLYYT